MVTTYPTPNITNYTGMFDYANQVTQVNGQGMFGASIPFLVLLISFMAINSAGHSPLKAAMVSSFITWILAMPMSMLGWVDGYIVTIFALLFAVTTALGFWRRREPWE